MMREYRPMAAPFAERRVAEPPTHVSFGRRIVRSDGNVQKSLTGPEKRAPAECHKRGNTGSSDWKMRASAQSRKLPFDTGRLYGNEAPIPAIRRSSPG
jgi:hypothetical protein